MAAKMHSINQPLSCPNPSLQTAHKSIVHTFYESWVVTWRVDAAFTFLFHFTPFGGSSLLEIYSLIPRTAVCFAVDLDYSYTLF